MWFIRHISLRTQLVALMAVLMLLGVAGIAWATAQSTRSALVGRIDDDLRSAYTDVGASLQTSLREGKAPDAPGSSVWLYAALYSNTGHRLVEKPALQVDDSPDLHQVDPADVAKHSRTPFTVKGTEPGSRGWRVLLVESPGTGRPLVVAARLRDTVENVERATASILVTGTLASMLMSMIGYAVVTRAFRPLRRVERTAGAIAQGDLSRRVEEYPIETEVGRLSYSLNAMLSQIEAAFRAMGASEEKMRRFVQDASHELRTPLVTIRGYSELYRHGGIPAGEPLDQSMGRIESEAKRMSQLVEDLLTLARLDEERPLEPAPVDLLVLAGDAVADAAVNAPDRQVRLVGLDGAPPQSAPTLGDEAKLRQVVVNLMTNALRYTPEGTPIEVAVGVQPVLSGHSDAVLAIVDHGPGIPPEDAQRIFERFYRADSSRQRETGGTGLGLAIVAAIAKQHDGGIRLADTPGGGATMSLHVPFVAPADDADAAAEAEVPEPETSTGVLRRLRAVARRSPEGPRAEKAEGDGVHRSGPIAWFTRHRPGRGERSEQQERHDEGNGEGPSDDSAPPSGRTPQE